MDEPTPEELWAKKVEIINQYLHNPETTGGRDRLWAHLREKYPSISRRDVAKVLADDPIAQQHRPLKRRVTTRPIIIADRAKVAQIDLIDFKGLTGYNDGYRYGLTYVDLLSKWCAAKAITQKTQKNVVKALQEILQEMPEKWRPKTIQADNGGEFATQLEAMLKALGIKTIHSQPYNPRSQGAIERFNRTLKSAIFSLMARNKTNRWIDMLEPLCQNFNTSKHESTGYTPKDLMERPELSKDTVAEIHARMERRRPKQAEVIHQKFDVGDYVRVALTTESAIRKQQFRKRIRANWSSVIFQIYSVSEPERAGTQERYLLKNLTTNRRSKKQYYGYQMIKVSGPDAPELPEEADNDEEQHMPADEPAEAAPVVVAPPRRSARAYAPSQQALQALAQAPSRWNS